MPFYTPSPLVRSFSVPCNDLYLWLTVLPADLLWPKSGTLDNNVAKVQATV